MVTSTWDEEELPVLDAIYEAEKAGRDIDLFDLSEVTSFDQVTLRRVVRSLYEAGLVNGVDASDNAGFDLMDIRLGKEARVAIGQWPSNSDPFADFTRLLEQTIRDEKDPERKTNLQSMLDSARGVGRDVMVGVLTAWVRSFGGF